MKLLTKNKIALLAMTFFIVLNAYADEEHFFNSISGVHFAADSSVNVKDDKFQTPLWFTIQKNMSCTDLVTLQLNEDTSLFLKAPHTCRVDLEIYYWIASGAEDSVTKSLYISYDSMKSKAFNFRSTFKFSGGFKVKSKILAVYYDGSISVTFPKVFELDEDIFIDRVYDFSCVHPMHLQGSADAIYPRNIYDITWVPLLGADEYDLEWTFYDDSSTVAKYDLSTTYSNFNFLYRNNATRVTLEATDYNISLLYNLGYIFFRVRGAHYDTLGNRIEGPWTSDTNLVLSNYASFNGHHYIGQPDSMNWQYTAAYAEEGKRKEVASYFDGTLRNRQSVTINNTEGKAIVGETMYDYQGRAAVTTLPAPIDSGKIVFYNKFNVDPGGSEFYRNDFDTGGCGQYPTGMDSLLSGNARGSSGYYSSSNPDKSFEFNAYLPDAQGYPYSQTEYTADNTGRIARQSLPGKTHFLGSGHETKYFYGKAPQEEIDMLFGNEVGDNSHYLKNMVIDANGQISVSYLDANGKTIATALAGNPPMGMDSIASYHPATVITENLLDSNQIHPTNTSISSTFGLLTTNAGNYHFAYKLFPSNYSAGCSNSYCSDCIYDIELMITPACGGAPPVFIHHDTNFTYREAFDTACVRDSNVIDTFTVYLEPGQYNITRLITVDQGAINFYTNRFFSHNTCYANFKSFLDSAIANTNFSGCDMTCQTCLTALGTQPAFVNKYITQLIHSHAPPINHQDTVSADSMYAVAVANCNQLCAPANICDGLYQEMLADVSPGGQYCKYDTIGGIYKPADSTSVLRVGDYEHPNPPYKDGNGHLDTVLIGSQKFLPQQLTVKQFVQNWQPSWAASLVMDHPEYCYYLYCQKDTASNRYDADMENTNSFTVAMAAGFINPVADTKEPYTINWKDPYFTKTGYGAADSTIIRKKMEKYVVIDSSGHNDTLSLWRAAALAISCEADTLEGRHITFTPPVFGSGCAGNLNMEWEFFRGAYIALKEHIQDSLENVYVKDSNGGGCSSYAACIGQNISPCSGTAYASKQPRHITPANLNNPVMIDWSNPNSASRAFDSTLTANCDTQCKSYAYAWLEELNGCGTLTVPQKDSLVAGFEEVCEMGCNVNHPFGSSTMPGFTRDSRGDRDFEDVIRRVLGESRANLNCDSLDINMPPPYVDSTGITGPPVTYYRPEVCICNELDTLLNHYYKPDSLSHDPRYKNFADYLNKTYGGNLADSTVYQLMALCQDTACFFAEFPAQLPIWMTCCTNPHLPRTFYKYTVTGDTVTWDTTILITQGCCVKCSDVNIGIQMFQKLSPPMVDTLHNYQILLENFLNNLYGFNLTYNQYMAFYDSCSEIHCTVTVTTFTTIVGTGTRIDSTCGGYNIIDTFETYGTSLPFLVSRHTYNARYDSLSPTLCNEPLNTVPPPSGDTNNCVTQLMNVANYNATNAYNKYMDSIVSAFTAGYIAHCMMVDDSFHMNGPFDAYHYTLYYFDQAENLVKTIPPQGVHPITAAASLDSVVKYRAGVAGYNPVYPNGDSLSSLYWFNTLNSPVQQATPDGNITHYWYDYLGRLVLSQNPVQAPYLYSYTEYDALNRIEEVGQANFQITMKKDSLGHNRTFNSPAMSSDSVNEMVRNPTTWNYWLAHTYHTQVTHTWYDSVVYSYIPLAQENLRKRISSIIYAGFGNNSTIFDTLIANATYTLTVKSPANQTFNYDNAIHYSYDIEGNVATQLTDVPINQSLLQRYKRTDYYYDLVSGKVNELVFQHDTLDQFMQAYEYDADNRITDVYTSHDSLYAEHDANYSYYWHGPLAREIIGRRQVQGVDYAYTLNGWIKGVNSSQGGSTLTASTYDMGHDGDVHGANATIGRDAYGFALDYFAGDYRPIGGTTFEMTGLPTSSLYNGNIAGATYSLPLQPKTIGYSYKYDQLNRINAMQAYITPDTVLNNWSTGTTTPNFEEKVSYDENGNILLYLRHGNTRVGPLAMDSLTYNYTKGTNQLAQVKDAVPAANYPSDIDNETSKRNYRYNANGQLAKDSAAKIDTIIWNIYGKVQQIQFDTAQDSVIQINFAYDPLGNRIAKTWTKYRYCPPPFTCGFMIFGHSYWRSDTTLYSRDAQGNILAVYDRRNDSVWLKEWDIYGSKRIGVVDTTMLVGTKPYSCVCTPPSNPIDSSTIGYLEGQKQYELTNHLGNVLVTVSDKKTAVDTASLGHAEYYLPVVVSAQDYNLFGSIEPGRSYSILGGDSLYHYLFNGKLHDDDIYGNKNSYDYGARFYDPRLGRFLSTDPIESKHPEMSPYSSFANNPIFYIDKDGKDFGIYIDHNTRTITITVTYYTVKGDAKANESAAGAADFWNSQSGKYEYRVGKGDKEVNYKINFDVKVIPVDKPQQEKSNDDLAQKGIPNTGSKTTDNTSNTLEVVPDNDKAFQKTKDPGNTAGATTVGEKIDIKVSQNSTQVAAHEMGHTMGLSDDAGSVFSPNIMRGSLDVGSLTLDNYLVQDIVQIGLGVKKAAAPQTKIHKEEKGTAPANFDKGKVENSQK